MGKRSSVSRIFPMVLFLGLFAMAARNVTDPDIWWHLKTGQLMVVQKSVPHADSFSYTRAGEPWIAHEWLADVLLFEVQHNAGWGALIVAFALAIGAAFFLLYRRCGSNPYVAGAATLLAAFATRPTWGVRPQVLSVLLTSLWLLILERSEEKPKILWWTLPLTLLWVNLHAGFALGLVLYGLFLAGERVEAPLGRGQSPRSFGSAVLILALDLVIVPLNPNGARLFWYPIQTLHSAAMQKYIAEWASPNFHRAEYLPCLLIVLGTFAALSWPRFNLRPRDLLLLLVSLFAALRSIRLVPLFVLIAVPLLSRQLCGWSMQPSTTQLLRGNPRGVIRSVLNGAIALSMALFAIFHTAHVIRGQPAIEAQTLPEGAIAFLQSHPPIRPVFNHYDWGGYLIWRLYPSVRVFIDGRADLYGEEFFHEFADTYQFKDDWRRTLDRWSIGTVLVPAGSPLATGLRQIPVWTVSYEDSQAVIFTRSLRSDFAVRSPHS
jgi:hypothetical protein